MCFTELDRQCTVDGGGRELEMPVSYQVYPALRLKHVRVSQKTNLEELKDAASRYFEDPAFSPDNRFLVDLSELTDARARFRDVFSLKGFYRRGLGNLDNPINVAIAAPGDLAYGISHMFFMLMLGSKTMNVRIFSSVLEALSWLEIDPDAFTDQRFIPLVGAR